MTIARRPWPSNSGGEIHERYPRTAGPVLRRRDVLLAGGSLFAVTANTTTPYIAAYADLQNGPVVLEIPAADANASL